MKEVQPGSDIVFVREKLHSRREEEQRGSWQNHYVKVHGSGRDGWERREDGEGLGDRG